MAKHHRSVEVSLTHAAAEAPIVEQKVEPVVIAAVEPPTMIEATPVEKAAPAAVLSDRIGPSERLILKLRLVG